MNKLLISLVLLCTSFSLYAASGSRTPINSSSWSLLFGHSQNENDHNYRPVGQSYKVVFGYRFPSNVEINFFGRLADQKDDLTISGVEGNISRGIFSYGLHFGYWIFSALNIHAGYALHTGSEEVKGNFSSSKVSTIKTDYQLNDRYSSKGLMAGADLAILQNSTFQLFVNYEYYHLNHINSHEWDAMVGLRFYPGTSKGGAESSFFAKFFKWVSDRK